MKALDEFLPVYEFSERHQIAIDAPRERIDHAIRSVTLDEIPVARALVAIRRLGRPYRNRRKPLLEGGLTGAVLENVPGEGIVLGLRGDFWRLRGGVGESCEAVIDFRVLDGVLTTETRVHVADPAARRKFRRYWRVIRPFSGLIRVLTLREARRKAEA